MPEPKASADITAMSFEDALREFEQIVHKLEAGDVPLEDSIRIYERGAALKAHCETKLKEAELKTVLHSFNLITDEDAVLFSRLRRSAEGRAVPLPAPFSATNRDIASLALGFARGEPSALAVPYARLDNA